MGAFFLFARATAAADVTADVTPPDPASGAGEADEEDEVASADVITAVSASRGTAEDSTKVEFKIAPQGSPGAPRSRIRAFCGFLKK